MTIAILRIAIAALWAAFLLPGAASAAAPATSPAWINIVSQCGADPTDTTDSTSAIASCVSQAISGGYPLYLPAGRYKVSSTLTIDTVGFGNGGFKIISDSATIDGTSISSGLALQIQRSGGTTGSPAVDQNFTIDGSLTVAVNDAAYAVQIGQANFADKFVGLKIDHMVATNASTANGAGAIKVNYVVGGNLGLFGSTAGGSASIGAVALEQVQNSSLGITGTAAGASAASLLIENGATIGNTFAGTNLGSGSPASNTCLSITSTTALSNSFVALNGGTCTTFVNNTGGANGNKIIGYAFAGTNLGPNSAGIEIVGRGAPYRYSAPSVASYTAAGVDDGLMMSSANATGAQAGWAAASLPVTLPVPSLVGPGWTMAFFTDASKAVVLTPSSGSILAGGLTLSSLILGPGNYEVAVVKSDGTNMRLMYVSPNTSRYNGISSTWPTAWNFVESSGYAATQGNNGSTLSSSLVSALTVTLPSTTSIQPGWTIGLWVESSHPITVQTNATSGGSIEWSDGTSGGSYQIVLNHTYTALQFDGAVFKPLLPVNTLPQPITPLSWGANQFCLADDTAAFQAAINVAEGYSANAIPNTGRSQTGASVVIPHGCYWLNSAALVIDQPGIKFVCPDGEFATSIVQTGTNLDLLDVGSATAFTDAALMQGFVEEGCNLIVAPTVNPTSNAIIRLNRIYNARIRDSYLIGGAFHGVVCAGCSSMIMQDNFGTATTPPTNVEISGSSFIDLDRSPVSCSLVTAFIDPANPANCYTPNESVLMTDNIVNGSINGMAYVLTPYAEDGLQATNNYFGSAVEADLLCENVQLDMGTCFDTIFSSNLFDRGGTWLKRTIYFLWNTGLGTNSITANATFTSGSSAFTFTSLVIPSGGSFPNGEAVADPGTCTGGACLPSGLVICENVVITGTSGSCTLSKFSSLNAITPVNAVASSPGAIATTFNTWVDGLAPQFNENRLNGGLLNCLDISPGWPFGFPDSLSFNGDNCAATSSAGDAWLIEAGSDPFNFVAANTRTTVATGFNGFNLQGGTRPAITGGWIQGGAANILMGNAVSAWEVGGGIQLIGASQQDIINQAIAGQNHVGDVLSVDQSCAGVITSGNLSFSPTCKVVTIPSGFGTITAVNNNYASTLGTPSINRKKVTLFFQGSGTVYNCQQATTPGACSFANIRLDDNVTAPNGHLSVQQGSQLTLIFQGSPVEVWTESGFVF